MILPCTCQHEFQDQIHGKGKRVHNEIKVTGTSPKKYRCTVCGTTREAKK